LGRVRAGPDPWHPLQPGRTISDRRADGGGGSAHARASFRTPSTVYRPG